VVPAADDGDADHSDSGTDRLDPGADRPDPDRSDDHRATVTVEYGDARTAKTVAGAVAREVDEIADDRSRATVDRDNRRVVVGIRARDLVALRAATNTWIGLVSVAEHSVDAATGAAGAAGPGPTDDPGGRQG
jgi:KEOPS complex subunit Pcc1